MSVRSSTAFPVYVSNDRIADRVDQLAPASVRGVRRRRPGRRTTWKTSPPWDSVQGFVGIVAIVGGRRDVEAVTDRRGLGRRSGCCSRRTPKARTTMPRATTAACDTLERRLHRPPATRRRPARARAVVAGPVVVGHRGHAVQALAVGALDEPEADRLEERGSSADRPATRSSGSSCAPRVDRRRATNRVDELATDAPPAMVRIDGDDVEHGDRRRVRADEADREPDRRGRRRAAATHDVPVKCRNHSRGRSCRAVRPPAQSSTCRTIASWSASVGRRKSIRHRPRQRDQLASRGEDAGDDELDRDEEPWTSAR